MVAGAIQMAREKGEMHMKAIVYTEYGPPDVLHLQEVAKPAPQENEILVKVLAVPVNYGDLLARNFGNISPGEFNMPAPLWLAARLAFGWRKPKKMILGSEFAGEIAAAGKAVKRFKPGDPVYGYLGPGMGAYAEYLCMPETGIVAPKPANMSDEEAAATPYGAIMALNLLRKVTIRPGQQVLINGASGGIGAAAVQLAKISGAEVTGVCSTPRLAYVKALGADKVIDYTQETFTRNGERYDLIFDILGRSSFAQCKDSLKAEGVYLLASFKMKALLQMAQTAMTGGKKVICTMTAEKTEDLLVIKDLVEAGKFRTIIDKRFPLEETAAAHRYVEAGHKQGAVVITVN
jgi:NADPH:quinone reductase-like Zn-dependent oxidoreductase